MYARNGQISNLEVAGLENCLMNVFFANLHSPWVIWMHKCLREDSMYACYGQIMGVFGSFFANLESAWIIWMHIMVKLVT